ncbi:uncharacterized protein F5891DRAFT_1193659 [Suillus fuscotomentosus]|uniref:Uncharacterized protein n=1 Tax=Suillus fuscotomentosus TaxID=1912939 RepID=A0AAD4DYE2_9AGAM|nr:uncharacterized protein F5891DRAFT_1193659 [Suillus fuscotomentosus]KAG1895846.1 hypothetical protein F5891DRAFT_1193659 [Suillus fuscotomentosus]
MAPQDERCCGIDRARKIVAERREAEKERQREAKKMRKREMEKKRERERVEDSGRRGDRIEVTPPPTNTIDRVSHPPLQPTQSTTFKLTNSHPVSQSKVLVLKSIDSV